MKPKNGDLKTFLDLVRDNYGENQAQKIISAYQLASVAHAGQLRDSGTEYITHPVAVSEILIDLGMDYEAIIGALLHDILEDTEITKDEILSRFGGNVLSIVEGVTKLNKFKFKSVEDEKAENFRKMFLAMSSDLRTIVVKLADRLHNMRTLSVKSDADKKRISEETLDIYAPIAARLGIASIKCELEDLAFRYLYPVEYFDLVERIAAKKTERQEFIDTVMGLIEKKLIELDIKGEINGRPKHFYSIYKKMQSGKVFEEIYDLLAVRIIVGSVKDCYAVLGAIHAMWKPLPMRFKDYIAMPKNNLYQSLHTTVIGKFSSPFEIQIRTAEMHRIAELGIAAHWKYKQGGSAENASSADIDAKIGWIREVLESQRELKDSGEFLDSLKVDLYTDSVFVFTPKGEVFDLPAGACGVDFAYVVHSEVGNRCTGVKINSKIVPLSTKLETGDIVEIITSPNSKGPSRDWLKFLKTTSAKNKVKAFFKKEMREENVRRGKEMLEREVKHRGYNLSDLISNKDWQKHIKTRYNMFDTEDLFAAVGFGDFTTNQVLPKLIELAEKDVPKLATKTKNSSVPKHKSPDGGILIMGSSDFLIHLSQCCTPVPGDKIVGFISRGKGVSIHRADCPNIKNAEPERLIAAEWPDAPGQKYASALELACENRNNLLADISMLIGNMRIGILQLNAKADGDNAIITIVVEISNSSELETLTAKLRALPGVTDIYRTKQG